MKNLLFLTFAFAITNSYADCVSVFNEGAKSYNQAGSFAKTSQVTFQEMKDLASAGASNSQICDKGIDARMASFLAAKSYKRSRSSFLEAINECSAPYDQRASELADKSTTAYNSNAEFIANMDNILGSKCGSKPITPILNQED